MVRGERARRGIRLMAAAIAAAAVLGGCAADPAPVHPLRSTGASADRPVPAAIRDLPLITSSGARVSLGAYRGKVVVLTDFLTLCGEECPMTSVIMDQMARSAVKAGLAGNVVFAEITVDPRRDTPHRLAAYRALFPAEPDWVLLTGTPRHLAALWKFFGVLYKRTKEGTPPGIDWLTHRPLTYDVAHQDAVIFLGKDGDERHVILGNANTGGQAPPATLAHFLDRAGRKNLAHPGQLSWSAQDGLQIVSQLLGRRVAFTASRQ